MENLSRYDRATVGLWRRSHAALAREKDAICLAEVAVHAVLAGLRRCQDPGTLFERYERETSADFALIGSLLSGGPTSDRFWQVRDAAFYLRWQEITDADNPASCSTSPG